MTGHLVALLHLCDSLFPIGAFSHSDGLETATSVGRVRTANDLGEWMKATVDETLGTFEAPGVARVWNAWTEQRFDHLDALDDELYALRPASAGREATRAMGSRLLKTWRQVRPQAHLDRLMTTRTSFTLPAAFGIVSAASAIPVQSAVEGYAYTRLASIVSAAMRLMPLGQHEGHRLLADALARVPAMAARALVDTAPLQSFTPMLDLAAMSQQYGHSRLFRS
jgi:urease accessory protein